MPLNSEEKDLLDIYIDEFKPNTEARKILGASDDILRVTLSQWKPQAIKQRLQYIADININLKKIENELSILEKAVTITSPETGELL